MNTPSPIAKILSSEQAHLRNLESHLKESIRGQEVALAKMASVLRRGELGLTAPRRPKGSFLLLGPTGVGKTESTVVFTRYLMGEDFLFRFDMSEYQTQESLGLLLGAKSTEKGILGQVLARASHGTLLFDEIEKAHPRVMDVFLQILDAARITLADGTTPDLSGFYVVFTSNIASGELLDWQHSSFATMERHVLARAQQWLRPELYARITEKLVFQRLGYDVQVEIASMMLDQQFSFLASKGYQLTMTPEVLAFVLRRGFHPRLGARPLRDTIEKLTGDAVVNRRLGAGRYDGSLRVVGGKLEVV
ncbi:ATP-dependent Clp protease ATP-binding subunit [Phragmitibacter flavus]|uniref:ATP-dependent Clp protease ATP-binding subunit n=1 Tax=Phragmitibacter flavus TaxID=2576071 RepID=A0A5R8KGA3_9BACT|nr:AAA family ATPase [Phragmitibacter flavus]TLD71333.1 ATP-dependent Clp protease ATP-binding subunit [Phragmitibacter flavus]